MCPVDVLRCEEADADCNSAQKDAPSSRGSQDTKATVERPSARLIRAVNGARGLIRPHM